MSLFTRFFMSPIQKVLRLLIWTVAVFSIPFALAPVAKANFSAAPATGLISLYLPSVYSQKIYAVTGQINDLVGHPAGGVVVQTNSGVSATTAGDGSYSMGLVGGYTYIITPQDSNWYHFSPSGQVRLITGDTSGINFSAVPNAGEYIYNGGFENTQGWVINATTINAGYTTQSYHSGGQSMQAGVFSGPTTQMGYSKFRQQVPIPPNVQSAQLSFWMNPFSTESTGHDSQYVMTLDSNGNAMDYLISNQRRNDQTWIHYQFDMSKYAGRTITILFGVYNDGTGGGITGMYIDDVSLMVTP